MTSFFRVALAAAFLIVGAAAQAADSVADFYKGKQITIVVGTETGGGYELALV